MFSRSTNESLSQWVGIVLYPVKVRTREDREVITVQWRAWRCKVNCSGRLPLALTKAVGTGGRLGVQQLGEGGWECGECTLWHTPQLLGSNASLEPHLEGRVEKERKTHYNSKDSIGSFLYLPYVLTPVRHVIQDASLCRDLARSLVRLRGGARSRDPGWSWEPH